MSDIQVRHPNIVTESFESGGRVTQTVKTFKLGTWEMWKIQQGLELLNGENVSQTDDEAQGNEAMAYFAWLIGSCPAVKITITATYES